MLEKGPKGSDQMETKAEGPYPYCPFARHISTARLWCHSFMPSDRRDADNVTASALFDHVRCTYLDCHEDSVELDTVSKTAWI